MKKMPSFRRKTKSFCFQNKVYALTKRRSGKLEYPFTKFFRRFNFVERRCLVHESLFMYR